MSLGQLDHGALISLWACPLVVWELASLNLCFVIYTVDL